jgi:hypothetical protein
MPIVWNSGSLNLLKHSGPVRDLYRDCYTFLFRPVDSRLWCRNADWRHTGVPDLRLCCRAANVMSCIDWERAALSRWHHWFHSFLASPFSMFLYLSDPLYLHGGLLPAEERIRPYWRTGASKGTVVYTVRWWLGRPQNGARSRKTTGLLDTVFKTWVYGGVPGERAVRC